MPERHHAERLLDVDAGLGGTQTDIGEQIDKAVADVWHLDPDTPPGRLWHRVDGTPEATGEIAHETENQVISADEREMYGHQEIRR